MSSNSFGCLVCLLDWRCAAQLSTLFSAILPAKQQQKKTHTHPKSKAFWPPNNPTSQTTKANKQSSALSLFFLFSFSIPLLPLLPSFLPSIRPRHQHHHHVNFSFAHLTTTALALEREQASTHKKGKKHKELRQALPATLVIYSLCLLLLLLLLPLLLLLLYLRQPNILLVRLVLSCTRFVCFFAFFLFAFAFGARPKLLGWGLRRQRASV